MTYLSRTARALSRPSMRMNSITLRTMTTIGENLKAKERVEEDRYMRKQDEIWKKKLLQLKVEEEHMREEALHNEVVEPVMQDVKKMLEATGDSVSDEALENLSKWKLDL